MTSSFMGIETAKRSLFTQTAALNTTGHNISNANTAGYSRQIVNMTAARPMEYPGMQRSNTPGQIGTGVEFQSITRVRQAFLDDQFRNQNKSLGSWEVQASTLDKLESIVNEPSDSGLRTVLDNFWKSWSDLSKDPENVTGRKIVRENAMALTDAFNQMSKQLGDFNDDLSANIEVKVNEINSTISTISNLNVEIQRVEGLGNDANDLRDQRDLLTDNLSKIVNINVANTPQGYNITMGNVSLVTGGTAIPTTLEDLTAAYGDGDGTGDLNDGEVFGMFVSQKKYVADYMKQLDTLANTIANGNLSVTIPAGSVLPTGSVFDGVDYSGVVNSDITVNVAGLNGLYRLGYTFETPAQSGRDFFTSTNGTVTAASIRLNPELAADSGLIATSLRTTGTGTSEVAVKGNNTMALLMANLKDTSFSFTSSTNGVQSGTIDDYFQSFVGQLGVQGQEAQRQYDNQQNLVQQVDGNRQSVSGVSLDEEMSNLIKFQHAYGAASRFMTTYDQILDKLINGTGQVGR